MLRIIIENLPWDVSSQTVKNRLWKRGLIDMNYSTLEGNQPYGVHNYCGVFRLRNENWHYRSRLCPEAVVLALRGLGREVKCEEVDDRGLTKDDRRFLHDLKFGSAARRFE